MSDARRNVQADSIWSILSRRRRALIRPETVRLPRPALDVAPGSKRSGRITMMQTVANVGSIRIPVPARPRVRLPRRTLRRAGRNLAAASAVALLGYLVACLFMAWYEPHLVYLCCRPCEEW